MRIVELPRKEEERKFKSRVVVVSRKDGKILFLKRKISYKSHPGYLDFPGGVNLKDFIFLRANEVKNYKVMPGTKRLIKKALGKFLL